MLFFTTWRCILSILTIAKNFIRSFPKLTTFRKQIKPKSKNFTWKSFLSTRLSKISPKSKKTSGSSSLLKIPIEDKEFQSIRHSSPSENKFVPAKKVENLLSRPTLKTYSCIKKENSTFEPICSWWLSARQQNTSGTVRAIFVQAHNFIT